MIQDNLTSKQKDYAVFLPAISGFYATYIGKQRDPVNGPYVDPARIWWIPDCQGPVGGRLESQLGLFQSAEKT